MCQFRPVLTNFCLLRCLERSHRCDGYSQKLTIGTEVKKNNFAKKLKLTKCRFFKFKKLEGLKVDILN